MKIEFFGNGNKASGSRKILCLIPAVIFPMAITLMILALLGLNFEERNLKYIISAPFSIGIAVYYFNIKAYYRKWNYLAQLYHKMVSENTKTRFDENTKAFHKATDPEYCPKRHLLACFAYDVFLMEMWAHDSFKLTFINCLKEASLLEKDRMLRNRIAVGIDKNRVDHQDVEILLQNWFNSVSNQYYPAEEISKTYGKLIA